MGLLYTDTIRALAAELIQLDSELEALKLEVQYRSPGLFDKIGRGLPIQEEDKAGYETLVKRKVELSAILKDEILSQVILEEGFKDEFEEPDDLAWLKHVASDSVPYTEHQEKLWGRYS